MTRSALALSGLMLSLVAPVAAAAQEAPPPGGEPSGAATPAQPQAQPGSPPAPQQPAGPAPAPYVPPKDPREKLDAAVDIGVGIFEFLHLDISWLISREWVVGIGLGAFPIDWFLRKAMGVDELSGEVEQYGFEMAGSVDTRLGAGSIFGRWFPTRKKKLFLEGILGVWRLDATARGTLDHEQLPEQVEVKVNTKVWVPMIGVHLGWRFLFEKGAFIDICGGANVMLSPGAEVTFGGATVEDIQEYDQAAATLDTVQTYLSGALEEGVERVAQQRNRIFPTAYLRFGWAFDLWRRRGGQ